MATSSTNVLVARACAASVLALGLVTLLGWSLGLTWLLQLRPGWTPMVVNTALGFVLSGASVWAAASASIPVRRLAVVGGVLLLALAVAEFCVLVFDLAPAWSLPQLHRPLQPGYPHPGRMAPNTTLCFLLAGAGLIGATGSGRPSAVHWVQRAATAVIAIGLLGVVGYALQLEYLYGWTGVVRMALTTGFGMIVLGVGLWNAVPTRADKASITDGDEVAAVNRTASLLLLLVAASAGIGGFAFLQGQVEQQVREELLQLSVAHSGTFAEIIGLRSARAQLVSTDPELASRMRTLARSADADGSLNLLRRWAINPQANGFSIISVRQQGRTLLLAGKPLPASTQVPVRTPWPATLLWKNGFVLRREVPVSDAVGALGVLISEQRLDALTALDARTNRLGESGEMAVCAVQAAHSEQMICFPLRSRRQPYRSARVLDGMPLPMDFALRGRTGSIIALDYRRHRVLAAYAPVGDTGLGLVVKRDVAEIYAPIRVQFQRIVLFLSALLAIGMLVLRRRLRPLLHTLEATRAQARENAVRFGAAVESNLDAFFILECVRDADGTASDLRYALLNGKAERLLGQNRERVVGKRLFDPFPDQRDAQMLVAFLRVIETGEPLIEERCGISAIGEPRWYHLQVVRLGDGLGVTVRDITRARAAAERVRHQALHDVLTGLPNRAAFEQAAAAAIIEAQKHGGTLALALLDLDGFKHVNDTLGHAAGDVLLQQVAVRLRDCLRPSDILARLGGDEFVLVLPAINWPAGAIAVANKLIAQIALPIVIDQDTVRVTASIGLSVFPDDGRVAATLLHSADQAMYRAKRAGRNGYALHQNDLHQNDPQRTD